MARQLAEINTSGELTDIKIGGAGAEKSVSTKEYVDSAKDAIKFTPQASEPSHLEGQVYYDDVKHTLNIHNDISDVTLNVGEEQYMRVINKTGGTIFNGKACRQDGVDVTTELPKVALAIATTINNARVLGMATHDILNGQEGFISTFGKVSDWDTSTYTVGLPIYLSELSAGDYTNTPPDIVTQVGGITLSDASGNAMVSIINHIALPTLFGMLQDVLDTFTLPGATTWEDIDNYQVDESIVLDINPTTGIITLPNTGWYRLTFSTTVTVSTATVGGDTILFRLWGDTHGLVLASTQLEVDSGKLTESRSMTRPFYAQAGDDILMQISSTDSTADLNFDDVSFDITSISIT